VPPRRARAKVAIEIGKRGPPCADRAARQPRSENGRTPPASGAGPACHSAASCVSVVGAMRSGNASSSGVLPPQQRTNASLLWQKDRDFHCSGRYSGQRSRPPYASQCDRDAPDDGNTADRRGVGACCSWAVAFTVAVALGGQRLFQKLGGEHDVARSAFGKALLVVKLIGMLAHVPHSLARQTTSFPVSSSLRSATVWVSLMMSSSFSFFFAMRLPPAFTVTFPDVRCRWLVSGSIDIPQARLLRYFRELLTELNMLFRLEPMPLTTARMTIEIPAAINPYSIAVAPALHFGLRPANAPGRKVPNAEVVTRLRSRFEASRLRGFSRRGHQTGPAGPVRANTRLRTGRVQKI
jgi:hypothetical protein